MAGRGGFKPVGDDEESLVEMLETASMRSTADDRGSPVAAEGVGFAKGRAGAGYYGTTEPADGRPLLPSASETTPLKAHPAGAAAGSGSGLSWLAIGVLLLVVGVGGIGAIQTTINNRAGVHYGGFILGTWIEFIGGDIFLLSCVLIESLIFKTPLFRFSRRPAWWELTPGSMGFIFVAATVGLTVILGFGLFFICVIVGQLLASAIIDTLGLFGSTKLPLTGQKIFALVFAMIGCILTVVDRLAGGAGSSLAAVIVCALLAMGSGALLPIQTSINRLVSDLLPSKLQTTFMSFFIGTIICTIALAIQLGIQPDVARAIPEAAKTGEWYLYIGGPGGAAYISAGVWFVRVIGSAAFFVALVCGQLVGSAAIDATGFLGAEVWPANTDKIVGIVIVLIAALLVQIKLPERWTRWGTCKVDCGIGWVSCKCGLTGRMYADKVLP